MIDKLEEMCIRLDELNQKLSEPEIIADREEWQKLAKEHSFVSAIVQKYMKYKDAATLINEAQELLDSGDKELEELAQQELQEGKAKQQSLENELKELLAPRDPEDDRNCVLEVRAGTGGEEAALFAADLLRMYTRYAERKGWKFELMGMNQTDIGGIKEATCLITGAEVFRNLKYESGVHRVQRIPSTESGGRIHTSAATVAVLPEAEDIEVQISPADLIIETHRSSGSGGQHVNKTESAIRMVHIPTGIVVTCQDEKSQYKNKDRALQVMKTRVLDYYRSAADAQYSQDRRSKIGSGDRSERIRTYNFPQGRVSDHRIGLTLYRLDSFMDGDIQEMLSSLTLAANTGELGTGETE